MKFWRQWQKPDWRDVTYVTCAIVLAISVLFTGQQVKSAIEAEVLINGQDSSRGSNLQAPVRLGAYKQTQYAASTLTGWFALNTASAGYQPADGCTLTKTGGFINSATTTTVVALSASTHVRIWKLVLANGATTAQSVTLQDTGGANIIGTSATLPVSTNFWAILNGTGQQWFNDTASGTGLQFVTTQNGPLTYWLEYTQCA